MGKKERLSSPEINEDAKAEIQSLFDEIFATDIKNSINEILNQAEKLSSEVSSVTKLSDENFSVLDDGIEDINKLVSCLGDQDEWGDYTLITFLNALSEMINNRTKCLNSEWTGGSLEKHLSDVKSQEDNILNRIESIQNENLGFKIDRLHTEIKQINEIMRVLRVLENNLNLLPSCIEKSSAFKDIISVQNSIKSDILLLGNESKEFNKDIKGNFEELNREILHSCNQIEIFNEQIESINQQMITNSRSQNEKYEAYEIVIYSKYKFLICGVGISLLLNIIMIIIILIK